MGAGEDYWADRPAPTGPVIGPNGFAVAPAPTVGVPQHRGSRWKGDSITLSTWSRVGVTVLLLLPVVWMVFFMGIAGVLFLALYVIVVLPLALRDVWRRTRISLPPLPPESRPT